MTSQALAIFCDDIRHEVSGKRILVGVYGAEMIVSRFPVTLPQLCIDVTIRMPRRMRPDSLTVHVYRNADLIWQSETPRKELAGAFRLVGGLPHPLRDLPVPAAGVHSPLLTLRTALALRDLELDGAAALHVQVRADGDVLEAGSLPIRKAARGERATAGVTTTGGGGVND
jgi:hypothetical protein